MSTDPTDRNPFALPADRAPLDREGLAVALELIEQTVGLPRVAAVVLERAVADGAAGDVLVDPYNEVTVQLWRDAARDAPPAEYVDAMFDLWAGLTGGARRRRGEAVAIITRAFAPRERAVFGGDARAQPAGGAGRDGAEGAATGADAPTGDDVLALVREAGAWGYRVPMPVAMALTAAALDGAAVELRATESVGRGWVVAMVEAHVRGASVDGLGGAFARWVECAQPGPLLVESWRDEAGGWHFVDVWASDRPSSNWQPPALPPPP